MRYAVGSLVHARGREWVVLPESSDDLLVLRPIGGTNDEVAGVITALEPVKPAAFDLPDPEQVGDHRSARLLRDAVRLGFRSSAGPFRSFGRINVEPRPPNRSSTFSSASEEYCMARTASSTGF